MFKYFSGAWLRISAFPEWRRWVLANNFPGYDRQQLVAVSLTLALIDRSMPSMSCEAEQGKYRELRVQQLDSPWDGQ